MTALPGSTYRIQLRGDMTLNRAAALAGYFKSLGVSHLYLSPIFTATPGSTHGYDVTDFNEIDPAIGGVDGFNYLAAAAKANGLGLILDFVPNHMGASAHNPWWRDVLQWGHDSDYREHFDIDWNAPKLVVPALGEPYGEALRQGRFGLSLDAAAGEIAFTYCDLRLPLTPPSYARILARIEHEPFPELARRFAVARPETADEAKAELVAQAGNPAVRSELEAVLANVAADAAALHDVHEAQVWRASYWRAAREGLTYRRFFEIADLVGVRVERPRVFEDSHRLLVELVRAGQVQGVRLDHIDGLADPKAYLVRLQEALGPAAPADPSYLLVEKILGPDERLRAAWPVAGTTGYEFTQYLGDLFVDPRGCEPLTSAYHAYIGASVDYVDMVRATKRRILTRNLAGELEFLRDLAKTIAERDPATRDYGPDSLRRAVLEYAAALPVYRTYVSVEGPDETDLKVIAEAADTVRAAREVEDEGAIDFVARMLRLDFPDPDLQGAALVFAARFQQTTGPVMAKALEDTVFYRYNRLIALNEVGGEPRTFGATAERFHAAMQARLAEQPFGLSATATHDTKRGEDARARLYAISEMPEAWAEGVAAWSAMLADRRVELDGADAPEPEFEWLFYQSLAGSWPADLDPGDTAGTAALAERLQAYMLKVAREAKLRTSWTAPVAAYEAAVAGFVGNALEHPAFLADLVSRTASLRLAGAVTSLAQLAIKMTAPGVPDIYQGTEFWDLSLVDPDNRRPVDYAPREAALAASRDATLEALLADWPTGHAKLRLLAIGLALRAEQPELFAEGDYMPLAVEGSAPGHAIAFARRHGGSAIILIATRLPLRILGSATVPLAPAGAWGDTAVILPDALAGSAWRDALSGAMFGPSPRIAVSAALTAFPAAILVRQSA